MSHEAADYMKWQMKSIISRRLDGKTPITALTEPFTISKPAPIASRGTQRRSPALWPARVDKQQLLRTASCKATAHIGPEISPQKPVSRVKLAYPKQKPAENLAVTELDSFVIKEGRAVRRGQEEREVEQVEKYEVRNTGYRLNLDDLVKLNKQSMEMKKELAKIRGPLTARAVSEMYFQEPEKLSVTISPKANTSRTHASQRNILHINQTSLYNITSDNPVPRQDVLWTRTLLKSPFTFNTSNWSTHDLRLSQQTAPLGRSHLPLQELSGSTAKVLVRYPYCKECVRQAEPITVHLS